MTLIRFINILISEISENFESNNLIDSEKEKPKRKVEKNDNRILSIIEYLGDFSNKFL